MGGLVSTWIGLREDPRFDFPLFEGSPLPLSTDFPPFEGSPLPLSTECEGTCDVAEASTGLVLLIFGVGLTTFSLIGPRTLGRGGVGEVVTGRSEVVPSVRP